ncbi:MAG TPA: hypothetical protein DCR93_16470 [Cytophagales bacterium]|nr:hypothetical protein [Cytophagales bacterium]
MKHIVHLPNNLKGFAKPAPQTYVAEVPADDYPLLRIFTQHPSPEYDFVQVDLPDTDEDLWICIRWKDQVFGSIRTEEGEDKQPPINFLSDVDLGSAKGPVFHKLRNLGNKVAPGLMNKLGDILPD